MCVDDCKVKSSVGSGVDCRLVTYRDMDVNREMGMDMDKNVDIDELAPLGGEEYYGREIWGNLQKFAQMLVDEGEIRGLIGPRERQRLWTRHILNSTAVEEFISQGSTVGDIGSGAGFPGLVLAIIRPDVNVTLIDSMERRTQWLMDVIKELSLPNVSVKTGRAESFVGNFSADYVTARAVAALKKLLPWTMPLVKPGGSLIALKGIKAEQEIIEAQQQLRDYNADWVDIYQVTPFGCEESTRIVEVKKLM